MSRLFKRRSFGLLLLIGLASVLYLTNTDDGATGQENIHPVDAIQAAALLEKQTEIIILDIRTATEFNAGHIEGALNIDYHGSNFKDRLAQLDPGAIYLLHCQRGVRSRRAIPTLHELGFTDVRHLERGFSAWKAAGLPVTKG